MAQDELGRGIARADLCRFLAACYYQPGPEFAEEKLFDSMAAVAARVHPDFAASARRLGEAFYRAGVAATRCASCACSWLSGSSSRRRLA